MHRSALSSIPFAEKRVELVTSRNRDRYADLLAKRHFLEGDRRFSVRPDLESKVAILIPFIHELVQDPRDSQADFAEQTDRLEIHYRSLGLVPISVMGASVSDFEIVFSDRSIPSVVVVGFGNLSAVAVPFSKDRSNDARYGLYDWLHIAHAATHLKLGKVVMLTCAVRDREFNVPFASGAVRSYSNIYAPMRHPIFANGIMQDLPLVEPVTLHDELSYERVKEAYPLERNRNMPGVPDHVYTLARSAYNLTINRHNNPHDSNRAQIPHPTRGEFRVGYQEDEEREPHKRNPLLPDRQ